MAKPFDSIFKEIFNRVIHQLAPLALNIRWGKTEELKDKTQITEEREADFLKKMVYPDPTKNCIFHAEFHTKDEDLRRWMMHQRAMLSYRYQLPVVQVVFYLREKGKPNIPFVIEEPNLNYRFYVVPLNSLPIEPFLESEIPEMVLLSILADFDGADPEKVVPEIIGRIKELASREGYLIQLLRQLEVFSNLRNLQPIVTKKIEAMPFHYDLETDIRYQQGVEIGVEKGVELKAVEFAKYLLAEGKNSNEQISVIAGLPLEKVTQIQQELANEKNGRKPKK